jgi:hypothetical protein
MEEFRQNAVRAIIAMFFVMISPFKLSLNSGQILDCSFACRLDLYHGSQINAAGKYRSARPATMPACAGRLLTG